MMSCKPCHSSHVERTFQGDRATLNFEYPLRPYIEETGPPHYGYEA